MERKHKIEICLVEICSGPVTIISFGCSQAFEDWNKTELDSFLIEITANILKFRDSDGSHLLPKIRDSAGQKGTGKWTAISALEYGTPVTLIGKLDFLFPPFTPRSFVTVTGQKSNGVPRVSTWPQQTPCAF